MIQVEDKKALHVRASREALKKGRVVAAELELSLGEIVSLALKFYAVIHNIAKTEGTSTQGLAKALEDQLTSNNKEKTNGEKTGKEHRRKCSKT